MKLFFKIFSGILLLTAGIFYLAAINPDSQAQGMISLKPDDPRLVALGAKIYKTSCAACHGANLEGQANWRTPLPGGGLKAPPHDESGHTWHHPDSNLFLVTKMGRTEYMASVMNQPGFQSDMPGFGETYSDAEIIAVLSYIKSTWPPRIRAQHDQINRGGSHH